MMIHLCRLNHFDFPVFTLDTGLLFPETVALKKALEDFFGINIESVEPDLEDVYFSTMGGLVGKHKETSAAS